MSVIFTPAADTLTQAISGTSAAKALAVSANWKGAVIELFNSDTATCFVKFGTSTVVAAAASSNPIKAADTKYYRVGPGVTHVAVIGTAGTLYITVGEAE